MIQETPEPMSPFGPRWSRLVRRLFLALFVVVPLSSPSPSSASGDQDAGVSDGTPIRIGFGDTEIPARLQDNATARALAAQLPLDGSHAGHDPTAGDIGYWAPDADFVLYYEEHAPY